MHWKAQPSWMAIKVKANRFLTLVKKNHFTTSSQGKDTLKEVGPIICQSPQSNDAFMNVNTEALPQDAIQWQHSRSGMPDKHCPVLEQDSLDRY